MTIRTLKYTVGLFLIALHVGLLILVVGLYFANGFNIDEFTTVIAVITPMFAGYTTSIIAFFISEATVLDDRTKPANNVYVLLMFAMPSLLTAALATAICLKASNSVFANFEDFKRFLLLTETIFASYAGMLIYSIFDRKSPAENAPALGQQAGPGENPSATPKT